VKLEMEIAYFRRMLNTILTSIIHVNTDEIIEHIFFQPIRAAQSV
jgi:hypothetical protein